MSSRIPKISVLVTVYNREGFLEQTLHSILESTFEDFEVIVVDDVSSDHSVEIAKQMASVDDRIQVHVNEKNLGDYPNRMKAASCASGQFLKYVDSDDLIYPHSLAIMFEGIQGFAEAGLGLSHSLPEDGSPYPWLLSPRETYQKHFLGRGCLSCGPSGAIIRRDAFEAIGGFNAKWGVLSDAELWFRMAAKWPTLLFPPGLVWWRRHQEQEYSRDDAATVYLQRGYELNSTVLSDSRCPLGSEERSIALARNKQHFARRLLSLALRQYQPGLALKLFTNSDLGLSDLFGGLRPYKT